MLLLYWQVGEGGVRGTAGREWRMCSWLCRAVVPASVQGAVSGSARSAQVSSSTAPLMIDVISSLRPVPENSRRPPRGTERWDVAHACAQPTPDTSRIRKCVLTTNHVGFFSQKRVHEAGGAIPLFPHRFPAATLRLSGRSLGRAPFTPVHLAARSVDQQLGVILKDRVVLEELHEDRLFPVLHLRHRDHPSPMGWRTARQSHSATPSSQIRVE
jgi:hypothetical protein